ncbi:acetyltransferase [Kiloniella spongiae]|uniref:Acetyltransferase n=1 Tax=Kiloniella spongiae TaxID=1489064 RepID=A0A0H2MMH2_9PROT|nr:acetyltransferase [Kiloniella spongiae]
MRCLGIEDFDANVEGLVSVLHACVQDGASVGFILPFSLRDSLVFWNDKVRPLVANGQVIPMVYMFEEQIVGTVQLCFATMPNQVHRADVSKLLVSPLFRKRGIAKSLMIELERQARNRQKILITLDTRTGDNAEQLYRKLGYETAGIIPDFCRDTHAPDRLDPTTYMYKRL